MDIFGFFFSQLIQVVIINNISINLNIFILYRFYWDLVMLILLIANVIILPVAISFFNDNWSHTGLLIFNLVSDSMFLLDIVVNFRTGLNISRSSFFNTIKISRFK